MQTAVAHRRTTLADLVSLTKPGITRMVVVSTLGGMWLAPEPLTWTKGLLTVLGMVLIVSGANALNCWLERDVDGLMTRTRERPLPDGRMEPDVALWFGLSLSALAVPVLTFGAGPLAALVAGAGLLSYVVVYTPLKRLSPISTVVGAVPGALPTLAGYAAVAGRIEPPAWVLFGILFLWQMPHFYAIGIFRRDEYAAAGFEILPVVRGPEAARIQMVRYATALLPWSLLLVPMGAAGLVYGVGAGLLGLGFLGMNAWGVFRPVGDRWARAVFHASLLYLTGIILLLVLDAFVR